MNRRYLDPLFFAFLFALNIIAWVVTWMFKVTPEIVVIMAPVFLSMTVLALLRSALDLEPRRFWSGMVVVTLIFGIFLGLAELLSPTLESITLEFSVSVIFMGIAVICSVVALFLAMVRAIPESSSKSAKKAPVTPPAPKVAKRQKTSATDAASTLPNKEPHVE